jgi:CxxC motif-containing protein
VCEQELICIGCPQGCVLKVRTAAGRLAVEGNACRRGLSYAQEEVLNPRRVLTTTVPVVGGKRPVVPVRSVAPIPKESIPQALSELRQLFVRAPVKVHQVIAQSVAGTGIAVVATWPVLAIEAEEEVQREKEAG